MEAPTVNAGDGVTAVLHRSVVVGPFVVTLKSYRMDFEQGAHCHDDRAGIDFVLAGGGSGACSGHAIESSPGALEYYAPGARHSFRSGPAGIRTMHVVWSATLAGERGLSQRGEDPDLDPTRAGAPALAVLRELDGGDDCARLSLEAACHELVGAIHETPGRDEVNPGWLGTVTSVLRDRWNEGVSLAELAACSGRHGSHVARTFSSCLKMTPGEYQRRVRLARAARRLAARESIASVAAWAGFADQAHFTRHFAKHFGVTPGKYRKSFEGGRSAGRQ